MCFLKNSWKRCLVSRMVVTICVICPHNKIRTLPFVECIFFSKLSCLLVYSTSNYFISIAYKIFFFQQNFAFISLTSYFHKITPICFKKNFHLLSRKKMIGIIINKIQLYFYLLYNIISIIIHLSISPSIV